MSQEQKLARVFRGVDLQGLRPFMLKKENGEHWGIWEHKGLRVPRRLDRFAYAKLRRDQYSGDPIDDYTEYLYSDLKSDYRTQEGLYNDIHSEEEE